MLLKIKYSIIFREKVKEINAAIELLIEHNYKIIDLENQIIDKDNIQNIEKRFSFDYKEHLKQLMKKQRQYRE